MYTISKAEAVQNPRMKRRFSMENPVAEEIPMSIGTSNATTAVVVGTKALIIQIARETQIIDSSKGIPPMPPNTAAEI